MRHLLLLTLLLSYTTLLAQQQDLASLAKGEYCGMNALIDKDDDVFGYITIYDHGVTGYYTKKFEYYILDKNLNPFANNTFEGDVTAASYYGRLRSDGTIKLIPNAIDRTQLNEQHMYMPSSLIIDIKSNSVSRKPHYDFDHGIFTVMQRHPSWASTKRDQEFEKKENGFLYLSNVTEVEEGGFIVFDWERYKTYNKNNRIMRYDEDKKLLWSYRYNDNGSKESYNKLYYLERDSNYLYAMIRDKRKPMHNYVHSVQHGYLEHSDSFYLLVLDMKTGKEVHKKLIPDPDYVLRLITEFETFGYGNIDNDRCFKDKIVLVGRMNSGDYYYGYSRMIINRNTFEVDLRTITYEDDFEGHLPKINKKGFVEKNYMLDVREIFIMKDGSVSMLMEKYKPEGAYVGPRTSDLVYVYTDKDFKVKGAKVFEKEKSTWISTDYLFSQNINNGKDLIFFYKDFVKNYETQEKKLNLYINTLIDGKFKQEIVPLSSKDDYIIFPYVAKSGYIMLQEYNKNAKYNQIRLERLNY